MGIKLKNKKNDKQKITSKEIEGGYKFEYLKFNLSFVTSNKKFGLSDKDKAIKADILERLTQLSQDTLLVVSSYSKAQGYELIDPKSFGVQASCKESFFNNGGFRDKNQKYAIIRLYPNNNPLPVRLIGKISNNVFYLFFIDMKHKAYK